MFAGRYIGHMKEGKRDGINVRHNRSIRDPLPDIMHASANPTPGFFIELALSTRADCVLHPLAG